MFFRKNMDSLEYSKLIKVLSELESRLDKLKSRLDCLEMDNETLRSKVLRKIQQKRDEIIDKDEQELPATPKSLNTFSPFG